MPPDPQRRRALLAALGLGAVVAAPAQTAGAPAPDPDPAQRDDLQAPAAIGTPFASHWVTTSDGVHLNVLERAPVPATETRPSQAPTIVLLPGWCMPARIWRAQLIDLGARWRTLAMDPRGQGDSEIPAAGYTADRRADDLHDVLAGHDRVILVAWSLGVLEALHYVYRHGSGRLLALALVDNSVGEPPAPKPSDFIGQLRRARAATVEKFVRSLFAHPLPEAQLDDLRDAALRMPLESSIALLSYPLPREHWRAVVHAFDRPLAYLVTPRYREQSQRLRQARPATKIEIFEQAGHALFVDEAPRFNQLLADWIDSFAGTALT